jgi:hypothetical protein
MVAADAKTNSRPVTISSARIKASSADLSANRDLPQPTMPYTCQSFPNSKVKCDKATPICSSCG